MLNFKTKHGVFCMYDYLIIGAGVIGLNIAKVLADMDNDAKILVIEKESDVGFHASGRNSGVLHAGFYYTSNSLKAKFTKEGNAQLTKYCMENNLKLNPSKKLVVVKDESELKTLHLLYERGIKNGVDVRLVDEEWVDENFKNVKTYKQALYSPTTSTVDPLEILQYIKHDLIQRDVEILFDTPYKRGEFRAKKIINCAGLYADKIAKEFGFAKDYTILPFKGVYLKYTLQDQPIDTNIYPVPNINNPFLGVHYTITVDDTIKIGPTAIPAFWRENYEGFKNFKLDEFLEILSFEARLFIKDSFGFRKLALQESKKYHKSFFVSLAKDLVKDINKEGFNKWSRPGIRAQLLNTKSMELLQDFVVEGDGSNVHVLNAVSPAFTSSMPFAKWVVEKYVL